MNPGPFSYRPEQPEDGPVIEALHDELFGLGRFARGVYRLRDGLAHEPDLSFVAHAGAELIASVRLTRIAIGGRPVLLLGPLAVAPAFKGRGAGRMLVRIACEAAREARHAAVVLVGDEDYFGPLGFSPIAPDTITVPGPIAPKKVMVRELTKGALEGLAGPATGPVDAGRR